MHSVHHKPLDWQIQSILTLKPDYTTLGWESRWYASRCVQPLKTSNDILHPHTTWFGRKKTGYGMLNIHGHEADMP